MSEEEKKNLVYLAAVRVGDEVYHAFCDFVAYANGKDELVLKQESGREVNPGEDESLFDIAQGIIVSNLLNAERDAKWQAVQIGEKKVALFLAEKFFAYQEFEYLRDDPFNGCVIHFVPNLTLEQATRDIARFEGWENNET